MQLNIKDKDILKKLDLLNVSGEFSKYPTLMLRNSSRVRVNPDSYLLDDDFIVVSPYFNLPREIYLYGKKDGEENGIYVNYWMTIFLNTIEKGMLCNDKFHKSISKYELTIGLPLEFRHKAYKQAWTRENIIEFLSCLFDVKLEQSNYQQEDLLELMAA